MEHWENATHQLIWDVDSILLIDSPSYSETEVCIEAHSIDVFRDVKSDIITFEDMTSNSKVKFRRLIPSATSLWRDFLQQSLEK